MVQKSFYDTLMELSVNLKDDKENFTLLEKVDYHGGEFLVIFLYGFVNICIENY